MSYVNQTDDPWFSAHRQVESPTDEGIPGSFLADEPASVLGCASSRLFCNPDLPSESGCMNTLGDASNLEIVGNLSRIWPDADNQATLLPLALILHQFDAQDIGALYLARGVPNLLARTTVFANAQRKALPDNQWQLELEFTSQAMLAAMQHYMLDYARGFWAEPMLCASAPCRRLCQSQVRRNNWIMSVAHMWTESSDYQTPVIQCSWCLHHLLLWRRRHDHINVAGIDSRCDRAHTVAATQQEISLRPC